MERYDVIVIGGGLLGCFTARALTRYNLKTALFERCEDVCTGISRANTAIVYTGCDTKPNTLKTAMCVKASRGFENLCTQLGVRHSRCGSLMVCFGERGEAVLRKKYQNGLENGVRDIKILTRSETLTLEPGLSENIRAGLYVPDTATANPWEMCIAAAENAIGNGAEFYFNSEVTDINKCAEGFFITAGERSFFARGVINCAGLSSDRILEMTSAPSVKIAAGAGDYYVLDTKAKGHISHIIFHEPEEKGKGLTLVPTVDGNILAGPTELPADNREAFAVSSGGLLQLRGLVREIMPSLPMEHVIRSFGALRPNPFLVRYDPDSGEYVKDGKSIHDFCIILSQTAPPFISLTGIKTPGFTCANELGEYVSEKIAALLGCGEQNPGFNPCREKPVRLTELDRSVRAALVVKNPAYGKIICRCGEISEGEVLDAIHMKPGAVTVDGVKRRTGTGMGRCQGGFCTEQIIRLLARELSVSPDEITKDGVGSYLLRSKRKRV